MAAATATPLASVEASGRLAASPLLDAAGVDQRRAGRPQHGLADRAGSGVRAPNERVTQLVLVGTAYPMKVSAALAGSVAARAR